MNAAASDGYTYGKDPREPQSGSNEISAPLAGLKPGRLVLATESKLLRLRADPWLPGLFWARSQGSVLGVRVQENTLSLGPGTLPSLESTAQADGLQVEIRLNCAIPWEIEFRQGVADLDADLRQLELHSLDILGSTSHARLALPQPSGSLHLYISGTTSQSTFLTYPGCAITVHLGRGASELVFDHQHYDVLDGETNLVSPGFNSAGRYKFCLAGAVDHLTIKNRGD